MTRERLLEKARRSHQLAILHRGLRDVSGEVADVRECLAAIGAPLSKIGATETELAGLVRSGYLAEARITFELAADPASTPAERDLLFSDLVALVTKAVKVEAHAETPIDDAEAARLIEEHDPAKGLVPWEEARNSGEFAGIGDADIAALDFDAIGADPPVARATPLPDDDPGPFIEIEPDDIEGEEPVITIEAVSIAPECLMPDPASDEQVMSPESVRMAIRFFGEKDAAELGLIPGAEPPPVLLTKVVRRGTVPPPFPKKDEAAADADV